MSVPNWYCELVPRRSEAGSLAEFYRRFVAATPSERDSIQAAWDEKAIWDRVNPLRVSRAGESFAAAAERIHAQLLCYALGMEREHTREDILAIATFYNLAEQLGEAPEQVLLDVSRFVGPSARQAMLAFVARPPEQKSLAAFNLELVAELDGGRSLRFVPRRFEGKRGE